MPDRPGLRPPEVVFGNRNDSFYLSVGHIFPWSSVSRVIRTVEEQRLGGAEAQQYYFPRTAARLDIDYYSSIHGRQRQIVAPGEFVARGQLKHQRRSLCTQPARRPAGIGRVAVVETRGKVSWKRMV